MRISTADNGWFTEILEPDDPSVTFATSPIVLPDRLFAGFNTIRSVVLPPSVQQIGRELFAGCSDLRKVVFPQSIHTIPADMFNGCSSLEVVELPDSVTTIESHAFADCTSLTTVELGAAISEMGSGCFRGCTSLKRIALPPGLRTIPDDLFSGCNSLADVQLPTGMTTMGSHVFAGCTSLKTIGLRDSLEFIGPDCFSGCTKLERIALPPGIRALWHGTFAGCSRLADVELPANLISIESYAFSGCSALCTIDFPRTLKSIGFRAFENCSGLTSVNLPEGLTSLEYDAFVGCESLQTVTLPPTLRGVDGTTFDDFPKLRKVKLPLSLAARATSMLQGDARQIEWTSPKYELVDDFMVDESGTTILSYCGPSKDELRVPEQFNRIAPGAFAQAEFKRFIVPTTVVDVGNLLDTTRSKEFLVPLSLLQHTRCLPGKCTIHATSDEGEVVAEFRISSRRSKRIKRVAPAGIFLPEDYDRGFRVTDYQDELIAVAESRLRYSNTVPRRYRRRYREYLQRTISSFFQRFVQRDDIAGLSRLAPYAITRKNVDGLIAQATNARNVAMIAFLLDFKNKHLLRATGRNGALSLDETAAEKYRPGTPAYVRSQYRLTGVKSGRLAVVGYKGSENEITLPTKYGDLNITVLNPIRSFGKVTKITVPPGYTHVYRDPPISDRRRWGRNDSVLKIELANTVTTIGTGTLGSFRNLQEIHLGTGVSELASGVFRGCAQLHDVYVASSLQRIEPDIWSPAQQVPTVHAAEGSYAINVCKARQWPYVVETPP